MGRPGRAGLWVEFECEGTEHFLGRRVDGAKGEQEFLARTVRVDAVGILRAEQVLERGVGGDSLHDDVDFPLVVPVVEDDGVPDLGGRLLRGGDANLDRLASRLHLPVVPVREVEVMLAPGGCFFSVVRTRRVALCRGVRCGLVLARPAQDEEDQPVGIVPLRSRPATPQACKLVFGQGDPAPLSGGVGGEQVMSTRAPPGRSRWPSTSRVRSR